MNAPLFRAVAACPACGASAAAARELFDVPFLGESARVLECRACGLLYKSLLPTDAGLSRIYAGSYEHFQDAGPLDPGEVYSAKQKLTSARRLLGAARSTEDVRVLDIGCGHGRFVDLARRLGYAADGIDPYLPPEAERDHVHRGEPGDVPPATYDVALMLNVAEHVVDPHPIFRAARRLLRPGGVLLLTCPYGGSLARRVHRARWVHLALDEHILFWTPRSLSRALRADGFLGPSRYRISGSPFPYGRCAPAMPAAPQPADAAQAEPRGAPAPVVSAPPPLSHRAQAAVWRVARALMRSEPASNAVRRAVHLTQTGDYLELLVGTG